MNRIPSVIFVPNCPVETSLEISTVRCASSPEQQDLDAMLANACPLPALERWSSEGSAPKKQSDTCKKCPQPPQRRGSNVTMLGDIPVKRCSCSLLDDDDDDSSQESTEQQLFEATGTKPATVSMTSAGNPRRDNRRRRNTSANVSPASAPKQPLRRCSRRDLVDRWSR
ncbi:expressed unknown protein [Seminavis robusta]|uniref:Uncharacterized protein n=1 Tax=Seminavis robusta TaxID=568900 RepID=A0A9N8GZW8_9STRA|nr:expressed unknown protein [Seminavis robusta]|eukprot:Sro10_g008030.1 n/a (169) ;mRNA; r:84432-84938